MLAITFENFSVSLYTVDRHLFYLDYCLDYLGNMTGQDAVLIMNLSSGVLSEKEQNQEATVALINYFSEISRKRNVQIDYQFLEEILKSSGMSISNFKDDEKFEFHVNLIL